MVPRDIDQFEDFASTYRKRSEMFLGYLEKLANGDPKEHLPITKPESPIFAQIEAVKQSWAILDKVGEQLLSHKQQLLHQLSLEGNSATKDARDDKLARLATEQQILPGISIKWPGSLPA